MRSITQSQARAERIKHTALVDGAELITTGGETYVVPVATQLRGMPRTPSQLMADAMDASWRARPAFGTCRLS